MGNWRTVRIVGSIAPDEVEAVRTHLTLADDWSNFGPLVIVDSLCSLGDWPADNIDMSGNLAERDYSVHDVYDALWPLVVQAPSMNLKVHCGGDGEDQKCVATIYVEDGVVFEGPPEIETVDGVPSGTMMARLFKAVTRP